MRDIFGFSLRDWRGDEPERYFGELGTWAEQKMVEFYIGAPGSAPYSVQKML